MDDKDENDAMLDLQLGVQTALKYAEEALVLSQSMSKEMAANQIELTMWDSTCDIAQFWKDVEWLIHDSEPGRTLQQNGELVTMNDTKKTMVMLTIAKASRAYPAMQALLQVVKDNELCVKVNYRGSQAKKSLARATIRAYKPYAENVTSYGLNVED
eukprot:3051921-Karenia_brevis.AAC.1